MNTLLGYGDYYGNAYGSSYYGYGYEGTYGYAYGYRDSYYGDGQYGGYYGSYGGYYGEREGSDRYRSGTVMIQVLSGGEIRVHRGARANRIARRALRKRRS